MSLKETRQFLYWLGIFVSLGANILHSTLAILFEIVYDVYYHIAAIFVIITILVAVFVAYIRLAGRRKAQGVRANKSVIRVTCIIFLIVTTILMMGKNTFDGIAIAVLGIVLYWFIMNKDRITKKHTVTALFLVTAISAALVPVVIDRAMLRYGKTNVTIIRNTPGNSANLIVETVEKFNATADYNWSSQLYNYSSNLFNGPSKINSYFSGVNFSFFLARVVALETPVLEPIIYSLYPYGSFSYIMNCTILTGNLATIYSNTSITLVANGTRLFDSNAFDQMYGHYYYFMNASFFSQPHKSTTQVNSTDGYLVTLSISYDEIYGNVGGNFLLWQQGYFLTLSSNLEWAVALSDYTIS